VKEILGNLGRIEAADVIGLEDGRIDHDPMLVKSVSWLLSPRSDRPFRTASRPTWQLRPMIGPCTTAFWPMRELGHTIVSCRSADSSTSTPRPGTLYPPILAPPFTCT